MRGHTQYQGKIVILIIIIHKCLSSLTPDLHRLLYFACWEKVAVETGNEARNKHLTTVMFFLIAEMVCINVYYMHIQFLLIGVQYA